MAGRGSVREVAARSYWREADARVIVEDWSRSGRTLRSYCSQAGLSRHRVGRWAARLGRGYGAVRFHPVEVVAQPGGSADRHVIEVELGGGKIVRLPAGFAAEDLRRVVQVLGERRDC